MTRRTTSVAMTATTEKALLSQLVRSDGQEDVCLATYRPSTGMTRVSALITAAIPPESGDRFVHGNATITAAYILRGAEMAQSNESGLVLLHSHPGAETWQFMSEPDRDTESSYANLVRGMTGLPLVGMTLATSNHTWSARHWNIGVGKQVDCTHSTNVRVIGDRLAVSWNGVLHPAPQPTQRQLRTVSAWGEECQSDLVRRRVLLVGAGSVGLDVVVRLAASGLCHITVMDFDVVQYHNLDRLIGAKPRDARLMRPKTFVAQREATGAVTAEKARVEVSDLSICEPEGLQLALDHDLIFSCVDRPWPRAVLNSLAYSDFIPVIDGGIGIDTFADGRMRNATWRSHVIRPMRPCMSCNRQLDLGQVIPDRQSLLNDPEYIAGSGRSDVPTNQNVAPLSVSVAASLLAQYISFSVAPAGLGDPGPLRYALSSHFFERLDYVTRPHCSVELGEGEGDQRAVLTGRHEQAERLRQLANAPDAKTRLLRWLDDRTQSVSMLLDRLGN
jgi:hypothetical protein